MAPKYSKMAYKSPQKNISDRKGKLQAQLDGEAISTLRIIKEDLKISPAHEFCGQQ
jgi:hypothetical protein